MSEQIFLNQRCLPLFDSSSYCLELGLRIFVCLALLVILHCQLSVSPETVVSSVKFKVWSCLCQHRSRVSVVFIHDLQSPVWVSAVSPFTRLHGWVSASQSLVCAHSTQGVATSWALSVICADVTWSFVSPFSRLHSLNTAVSLSFGEQVLVRLDGIQLGNIFSLFRAVIPFRFCPGIM